MFSVSPEIYSVLSQASRWLFIILALMLFFLAFSWHHATFQPQHTVVTIRSYRMKILKKYHMPNCLIGKKTMFDMHSRHFVIRARPKSNTVVVSFQTKHCSKKNAICCPVPVPTPQRFVHGLNLISNHIKYIMITARPGEHIQGTIHR